jgi:hypothetical protein
MPRDRVKRGLPGEERYWRLVYLLYSRRRAARRITGRRQILWRSLYTVVYGLRLLRRVLSRPPEPVAVEKLKPGQLLGVVAIDPRTLTPEERKRYKR